MRRLAFCLFSVLAAVALAAPAQAQVAATVDCTAGSGTLQWPADDPLWTLTFVRPLRSSSPRGSGLEIRDVRYRGHLVLGRGHVPIINVNYDDGDGCGCFRDWADEEVKFTVARTGPNLGACFATAEPGSVTTVCQTPDQVGDVGNFVGVAAEDFGDHLTLTSHLAAGWYRYRVRWRFYRDGRIQPEFAFGHTFNTCTASPRQHHAYWRLDFDLDGPDGDTVTEFRSGQDSLAFDVETKRLRTSADDDATWVVRDRATGRGYRLVPGAERALPADAFSYADVMVARYKPTELDDGGSVATFEYCNINFEQPGPPDPFTGTQQPAILDGESVADTDLVVWYRTGTRRVGEEDKNCRILGPTLEPVGAWGVGAAPPETPPARGGVVLEPLYPNPFRDATTARFHVPTPQTATLELRDALGRTVRTLWQGTATGTVTVPLDGSALPSGRYTLVLRTPDLTLTTQVTRLR